MARATCQVTDSALVGVYLAIRSCVAVQTGTVVVQIVVSLVMGLIVALGAVFARCVDTVVLIAKG
jgi:preprotein translocase subunit SecF